MNHKLTNALLAIIAACLLVQVSLSVVSAFRTPFVVVRNGKGPLAVEITNEPVSVTFDGAIQFKPMQDVIPVTIEGINGKPVQDLLATPNGVLPVQIVPTR